MAGKKEIRNNFRNAVFARDRYKCRCCGFEPQLDGGDGIDAHHITDRSEMPEGGYVSENGISLCPECHKKAEVFHQTEGKEFVEGFHPNDLYSLIGSSYELAFEKSEQLKNE